MLLNMYVYDNLSSHFLILFGDDRVACHMRVDVVLGDASYA